MCTGVLSSVSAAPVVLKNSGSTIAAAKLPWHPERIVIAADGSAGLKEKTEDLTKTGNCDLWDLVFQIDVARPGRYGITVSSIIDDFGKKLIPGWNRAGLTFCGRFRIDQEVPTFRNIAAPWLPADKNQYHVGNFYFEKGIHTIALQMPRGFRVKSVKIAWAPVAAVPAEVQDYRPGIVPSAPHPRVWVNAGVLPGIRAGLQAREHRDLYAAIRNRAMTPYKFDPVPGSTVPPDTALENAVIEKAFVYLMEKDPAMGKEAAQLMSRYFDTVRLPTYTEALQRGITKATGIEVVARHEGIPLERTVAFGDSLNDLGMLRCAGIGCVMADAPPELMALADFVAIEETTGVAELLRLHFL